jgi:hypothetical protein
MGNSRDSETLISQQLRTVIASLPDLLESYTVTANPTLSIYTCRGRPIEPKLGKLYIKL